MILYFDSPEQLHNIALNFRTMELLGFQKAVVRDRHAVFLREKTKGWLRKANKLSGGAFHKLDLVVLDEHEGLEFLKSYQGRLIATDFCEGSISMDSFQFRATDCLVIGGEGGGFQAAVSELCPSRVHIPTLGQTQSFNVSVAVGILLYKAQHDLQKLENFRANAIFA